MSENRLEALRETIEGRMGLLPYALLAASTALVLFAGNVGIPRQPLPVMLTAVAVTAAWVAWMVTLHPQWAERRGIMVVFFAGLVVLSGVLVWCSPFYGFFAWAGYQYTVYALRDHWRLVGAAGVAFVTAVSQVGGFGTLFVPQARPVFALVLLFNLVLATVMTFLATMTSAQAERRARMIRQLAEANDKLAAALTENAGLHAQLLVQAREAGVLDERQRMAGEIHDVLAQGLTGIVTQLEAADQAADRPADRRRHLGTAAQLARESLTEARRSVRALRPRQLAAAALPEALADLVDGWSTRSGVPAELITTGPAQPLLPEIETTLLRTAQEALANVARHAAASRVALTLSYLEDLVTLDVRDDGTGFDPGRRPDATYEGGFGLTAMRERIQRIAGTLVVESEPGAGTAISACVPAIHLAAAA